jgi:serine protease AprX
MMNSRFRMLSTIPISREGAKNAKETIPPFAPSRLRVRQNRGLLMLPPLLIGVMLAAALVLALAATSHAQTPPGRAEPAPISPHLQTQLARSAGPVSFLVVLEDQLDPQTALRAVRGDATVRRAALYRALTAHAARTQAPLRAWLDAQGIAYQPFYLVNMLAVEGDLALARQVAQRAEVNRLAANPAVRGTEATRTPHTTAAWLPARWALAPQAIPYGLVNTNATQVWELGVRGAGIVVGSQDTGVQWEHPALQKAYRGWNAISGTVDHLYNWADAFSDRDPIDQQVCDADPQTPCDDNGHGTHTVGTMLGDATAIGDTVIGMAPDAQWIGCRNMRRNFGTPASYTACFEFMLAPYPQGGDPATEGRPELGAHVINNSWGCPPGEGCDADSLRTVVETVRAAGIVVVASAGNAGSGCSSIRNPIGLHDASFTVGAIDISNNPAGFSSRGPVTADGSGRRKPDIAAPGVNVRSAGLDGGVNLYLGGTSMAAPHVAGAVALLWSAAPDLIGDVDLTEQILLRSATPNPNTSACDGGGLVWPNNTTGFGSLDALAAVLTAQQPATVTLHFVDGNQQPVSVTQATLIDPLTGHAFPANATDQARAEWARAYVGEYHVAARDSVGIAIEVMHTLTITRGATITQTVIVTPQVHIFYPIIVR